MYKQQKGLRLVGHADLLDALKERNAQTFRNEALDAPVLCLEILQEAALWLRAGYSSLSSLAQLL